MAGFEEDLATVVEGHHAKAAGGGAHCVQKMVEVLEMVAEVAAGHTVAADCMLVERSWDDSSEQTKEQVEGHAA